MRKRLASVVRMFMDEVNVYRSIMTDPRCPRLARLLLGAALAYALSPFDLIPDFIPVIGHLDDVLILPLLVWLAVRIIPKELIAEHRASRKIRMECPTSPARYARGPRTREGRRWLRRPYDKEGPIRSAKTSGIQVVQPMCQRMR